MDSKRILIVDDEPLTRKSLFEILKFDGYQVSMASNGQEALDGIADNGIPDVVISDLKMPEIDGLTLLRTLKSKYPDTAVVLMTAYGSIENAVEAMKEGAFDYVTKPIVDSEIKIVIQRIFKQRQLLEENKILRKKLAATTRCHFHSIIGQNIKMQKIYSLIETVAPTNATILIQGESGTGKRLVAHALHHSDKSRKENNFVEVSCGALPETLLESELFGHIKGSFTGAIRDRKGRFETADKGTIFLDEIDAFSLKLQVKLLRVLQDGEFEHVGSSETVRVDARVIAATNQDLRKCIDENSFREDLYYRLNVIPIDVPPLRERRDDIPSLVEHFLEKCLKKTKDKKIEGVSQEAMDALIAYDWPGNVRELENIIERSVILSKVERIEIESFPDFLQSSGKSSALQKGKGDLSLKRALKTSEKEIILNALEESKGNRKKAAKVLGINRTTLYNKMRKYGLLDE